MKNPLRRKSDETGTGVAAVDAMLDEGKSGSIKLSRKERKAEEARKEARLESVVAPVAPEAVRSDWSTQDSLKRFRSADGAWGLALVADVWQEAINGLNSRDSRDEAKGQIVNAIKGDKIKVLTTDDLMDAEWLGFVPDKRTLLGMDGFKMLREATYHWVLVDLKDDDPEQLSIQVLPDIVKFSGVKSVAEGVIATDRLFAQAGNESFPLFSEEAEQDEDVTEYSAETIDEVNEMNAEDMDNSADEDLNYVPGDDDDEELSDSVDDDDAPDFGDEDYEVVSSESVADDDDVMPIESAEDYAARTQQSTEVPAEDDEADEPVDDEDAPFGGNDEAEVQDEAEPEDDRVISVEEVTAEVTRRLRSEELPLSVDMDTFYTVFPKGHGPVPFPTDLNTSEWFNAQLRDMAEEFNTELNALHEDHMRELRRKFVHQSSGAISHIVDQMSLTDEGKPFATMSKMAEAIRDEGLAETDEKVRAERKRLQDEFDQQKKAEGDRARHAAEARYVRQYGPSLEEKQSKVLQSLKNQVHSDFNQRQRKMLDLRAEAAQQNHFRYESAIVRNLEEDWARLHEIESQKREEYAERLVRMVRDHLQDDVARAEALAEEMRRTDQVRKAEKEYQERLAEFKELHKDEDERLRAENERLRREFQQELDSRDAEFAKKLATSEDQLAFREEANRKMRDELNELLERKDSEFAERIKRHQEALDAADRRHEADELALKRMEDQQGQASKLNLVLILVILVVALLVGGMLGAGLMAHHQNADGMILGSSVLEYLGVLIQ